MITPIIDVEPVNHYKLITIVVHNSEIHVCSDDRMEPEHVLLYLLGGAWAASKCHKPFLRTAISELIRIVEDPSFNAEDKLKEQAKPSKAKKPKAAAKLPKLPLFTGDR
jgi:hypothetical protein